jgi:hypothetical protein
MSQMTLGLSMTAFGPKRIRPAATAMSASGKSGPRAGLCRMSPFDPIQTLVPPLSHRSEAAASIHLVQAFQAPRAAARMDF